MAIPFKDSLLVPYSTNVNTRLVASGVTIYHATAAQVTAYTAAQTTYAGAFDAMADAREAGNRSESLTAAKDAAKLALLDVNRQIYASVQADRTISDSDKILLGVHVRVAPSPVPPPAAAPGMDVVSVAVRTVSLNLHDSASASRRGKPVGAKAAYIYSFVGVAYPADASAWTFEGATTQPRIDVSFPTTLPGGTQVWFRCCWVNAKQQAGPMSVPIATTLQGGGTITESASLKAAA